MDSGLFWIVFGLLLGHSFSRIVYTLKCMLDELQSKYGGEFETERQNIGSEDSLKIGSSSDDWVIVSEDMGAYEILYKEGGYRGSPDEKVTVGENEVESEVERFVGFL